MDIERIKSYLRLRRAATEAEENAKALKSDAFKLEMKIVDELRKLGVTQVTVDGETIYLKDDTRASAAEGVGKEQIADALVKSGHGHFVTQTFNFNSISAWVRELYAEEEVLPDELRSLVQVHSNKRLGKRRA